MPGIGQLAAADKLIDPTRPPYYRAVDSGLLQRIQSQYTLNSLIYGTQRQVAIINGQSVSLGGRVGQATVMDISKTGVTLMVQGNKFKLELAVKKVKKW